MARKTGSQNNGRSIEKRERTSGKPHWRARVEVTDPDTGKPRWHTVGTFPTKTQAQQEAEKAIQDRDSGRLALTPDKTVGEWLDLWIATKRGSVSDNTLRDYEISIRKHIKPVLGSVKLRSLTPTQVQRQYDAWRDDGIHPRTIQHTHSVFNQALAHAVRLGEVYRNAAADLTKPSISKRPPHVWTIDHVRQFLDASLEHSRTTPAQAGLLHGTKGIADLWPVWHLLVLEGMRRGEALGLRWADINWERKTAHISQTVIPDRRAGKKLAENDMPIELSRVVIQSRTKTRAGARTVRLTDETITALKAHRTRQNGIRLAAETWYPHDLIICTAHGTPIEPPVVTRCFENLRIVAGLPRIRVHDLRHTSATMLLRAGVPAKIVSERLGHASVGITMDLYSHVTPDMQDGAAEAMSNILKMKTAG